MANETPPSGQARNGWNQANDFTMSDCELYDMGDNTKLHISNYHVNGNTFVLGGSQTVPNTYVKQGGAQESKEQSCRPEIPVEQDGLGPRRTEPRISFPSKLPTEQDSFGRRRKESRISFPSIPVPQENGFRDHKSKHQASSLYYAALLSFLSIFAAPRNKIIIFPLFRELGNTFEPEARAEYADPVAPSDIYTPYPSLPRPRAHIYSSEMLTHMAGYPLYMPTPLGGLPTAYRKKGIRIGDVGMVTANGAFDFLFNACQSDPGINPVDDFEFLKPLIRTSDIFNPGACLTSDHVCKRTKGNLSGFQCGAPEGAVLVLPKGAIRYEAMNMLHFQSHAIRHAISWYEYVLDGGRDVSNGSLYLVTECIKSVNWGIAVFYAADENLRLILDEGTCRWEPCDKVVARVGPNPKDIMVSDDEEPNQCLFLRGYKITLRQDVWDTLKSRQQHTRIQPPRHQRQPVRKRPTRRSGDNS